MICDRTDVIFFGFCGSGNYFAVCLGNWLLGKSPSPTVDKLNTLRVL